MRVIQFATSIYEGIYALNHQLSVVSFVIMFCTCESIVEELPLESTENNSVAPLRADTNFQVQACFHLFKIEVSEPFLSSVSTKAHQT